MPYVSVHVDLDDFDDEDLQQELESRGYLVTKDKGLSRAGDIEYVEHLAACGLVDAAREEALKLVGQVIGRAIR